jgi:hypothetical protein
MKACGECIHFKRGTGLAWQYCPVRKDEVSAKCKPCANMKRNEKGRPK